MIVASAHSCHKIEGKTSDIPSTAPQYLAPLLLTLLCLAALILNISLNYPYRPFPSDEFVSYSYVLKNENWLANRSEILFNSPMHIFSLVAVKQLTTLFGLHWLQTFLLTSACSISGAALFLGLTVHRATGQLIFSIGTTLFFLVSSWTQSYLHFYSYAPVVVLFMLASLYCFTRFYLAKDGKAWLAAGSGLCAGLFFLSGSSAKLLAGMLITAYIALIYSSSLQRKKILCFQLIGAALIPIIGLLPLYFGPLVSHLRTNVSAGNGIECLEKYGFLPTTPFPSFFYLLSAYSPALLALLVISLFICTCQYKKLRQRGNRGTLTLCLFGLVVIHTVVLDLLPFTKLGRTQYPLIVLALISFSLLYADLPVSKRVGRWLFFVFLVIALPLELSASVHTRQVRREAPTELAQLPADTVFVTLDEDPHRRYITDWLMLDKVNIIHQASFSPSIQSLQSMNRPVALIVGPTGPNSGKSILENCHMDDFYFSLPQNIGRMSQAVKKLPYYAHYPLFMMEEETSQCFYFRHQVPDYRSKESQLTIYYWSALNPDRSRKRE